MVIVFVAGASLRVFYAYFTHNLSAYSSAMHFPRASQQLFVFSMFLFKETLCKILIPEMLQLY